MKIENRVIRTISIVLWAASMIALICVGCNPIRWGITFAAVMAFGLGTGIDFEMIIILIGVLMAGLLLS